MPWNTGLTGPALNVAQINTPILRVMAGPGTGKTFVMKRRVMRLLEEGADPRRILAVTFTRNAAANLVKELTDLGVPGCENIQARTLHSFCFALLAKRGVFEFLDRHARPLVSFGSHGVLQFEAQPMLQDVKGLGPFGTGRDCTKRVRAFEAAWARLQSDVPGWPQNRVDHQFHDALLDWLRFHEAMLIGELVPEALRYLRNNPACSELQGFDHVIVDEYQDLNRAEQELLDHLAENAANAIVGDEDQSIYGFRYAHPQGIVQFAAAHAGTHDENLVECRRCGTLIVDIADHLIRNNHVEAPIPRIQPFAGKPRGEVDVLQWSSLREETEGLACYVEHLLNERGYGPQDILILCPRRRMGYGIRDALLTKNVATHSFYHEEALEEEEAQLAFTLLSLLADRSDRVSFRFWLGYGSPSWREGEYRTVRQHCEQAGLSPWNALEEIDYGNLQLNRVNNVLVRFRELKIQLAQLHPLLGPRLIDALFPDNQPWAKPLREGALLKGADDTTAAKLLDSLRYLVTQPEMPEEGNYVRVMSLHKSKGLSSKVVIVTGCIEGLIPTLNREETLAEQRANLQEQRRLFYVAITRAEEVLVLSSVTRLPREFAHKIGAIVTGYGGTIATRFLAELGPSAPPPSTGATWQARGFN
jgi:DNA helicase-2/ATP-dependent DNA helicase PcrA